MSRKANPTLIGAFVTGAILLLALATAIFGGSEYFEERIRYVAYYETDTKGLKVGSNVLLNGVRIGYVSEVALMVERTDFSSLTRVIIEVMPEAFLITQDGKLVKESNYTPVGHENLLKEGGLRASLAIQSFVTGQLVVNLMFDPEAELVMRGVDAKYPEIPTIRSDTEEFLVKLEGIAKGLNNLVNSQDIKDSLAGINKLINSDDTQGLTGKLSKTVDDLDRLINNEDLKQSLAGINTIVNDEDTQQLTASLRETLGNADVTLNDASALFKNTDARISELSGQIRPALKELDKILDDARNTLGTVKKKLDSESLYKIETTLESIEAAARSIEEFFDLMERNPEAVLKGKKP